MDPETEHRWISMFRSGHFKTGHFKAQHFQPGSALIKIFVNLAWPIKKIAPLFKLTAVNPGRRFFRDAD